MSVNEYYWKVENICTAYLNIVNSGDNNKRLMKEPKTNDIRFHNWHPVGKIFKDGLKPEAEGTGNSLAIKYNFYHKSQCDSRLTWWLKHSNLRWKSINICSLPKFPWMFHPNTSNDSRGFQKERNLSYSQNVFSQYLYIIWCPRLKYRLMCLWILKVFDEPFGESNTERRVRMSASISKQGTYYLG